MLVEHGRGVDGIRGRAPSPGRVRVPALWPDGALQLRGAEAPQHPFRCPPGGELRHEGPLLTGQGQVPGPRCTVQRVQQAGVRGPGMQSVLLQEVLSPLCPGEPWRLPSRDPAGPGEEEDPLLHAAFWPGLSQDLSLEPAQSPQCCQPHSWEQTCGRADWAPQEWPARSPALAPPG
ncbi:cysteine-rich DPF motif domain-containing protein 1 isoform X1 [Octodon degus]|uniref:Cysteine-rich DPF motif domain-containing protein 1 isoform X1 n=1 Tax=Octodon degus TaxID=10160 RepID=A0A6P6DDT0_OCTDE|nr:cysteine-rich DPF motif domain-containing protein 1 isoform X1 [Octodon degus]